MRVEEGRCFLVLATLVLVVLFAVSYVLAHFFGLTESASSSLQSYFWSVFNSVVLFVTLVVVAYYTFETSQLRKATVNGNALSFRPILIFDAGAPHCTATNKGNGPALNICLIVWDGEQMIVTDDSAVPGILPPGDSYLFKAHKKIDPGSFRKQLPGFASLIERIVDTRHSLLCLVYRDLVGNRFYSIANGSGQTTYDGVFEHGEVVKA